MENDDKYMQEINELLKHNPEMKQVFDLVYNTIMDTDEEVIEVETIEIDGKEYILAREITIKGTTYVHLINESNPLDMLYRKIVIEDGKEYLSKLDSEQEYDLVVAYEQKYLWRDIKRKQEMKSEDKDE